MRIHPTFDGRPILLGDEIDIAAQDGMPGETGTVCEIRIVRGVPWIHYSQEDTQVNEIIVANKGDLTGARWVVGHRSEAL